MERIEHEGTLVEVPDLIVADGPAAVTAFLAGDAADRSAQVATLQQALEVRRAEIRAARLADPAVDPVSRSVTLTSEG